MLSCIVGALLCASATHYIDGPLAYASPNYTVPSYGYAIQTLTPTPSFMVMSTTVTRRL